MKRLAIILLCAIGWMPDCLHAQQDSTATTPHDTTASRHNVLSLTLNYQSRINYFGRTDSLKSSDAFPTLSFESTWGLYAEGNVIFINNAQQTMNYVGTTIQAGYRFPESKHFSGNIFYTQIIYRNGTDLVQAAIKEQTGVNVTFKSQIVNLTLGGDLKFSDRTDVGATGGLDHLWLIRLHFPHTAIGIDPSVYMYMGTQNFTQSYIEQKDLLGIPISQQVVTNSVERFSVLDYELSLPLVLVKGKFNISLTPAYVMPENLITVPGQPALSEMGSDMFYMSAALGVRI